MGGLQLWRPNSCPTPCLSNQTAQLALHMLLTQHWSEWQQSQPLCTSRVHRCVGQSASPDQPKATDSQQSSCGRQGRQAGRQGGLQLSGRLHAVFACSTPALTHLADAVHAAAPRGVAVAVGSAHLVVRLQGGKQCQHLERSPAMHMASRQAICGCHAGNQGTLQHLGISAAPLQAAQQGSSCYAPRSCHRSRRCPTCCTAGQRAVTQG